MLCPWVLFLNAYSSWVWPRSKPGTKNCVWSAMLVVPELLSASFQSTHGLVARWETLKWDGSGNRVMGGLKYGLTCCTTHPLSIVQVLRIHCILWITKPVLPLWIFSSSLLLVTFILEVLNLPRTYPYTLCILTGLLVSLIPEPGEDVRAFAFLHMFCDRVNFPKLSSHRKLYLSFIPRGLNSRLLLYANNT